MIRKWFGYFLIVFASLHMIPGTAQAGTSTIFGGSLLEEGEVAVTAGGGFPDLFVQFDFANSRSFNLALKARVNYNLGLPFFGFYGSISAPIRIGILKPPASRFVRGKAQPDPDSSPLSLALIIEPGVQFIGLGLGRHTYLLGGIFGVGVMMSYRLSYRWHLDFGIDSPVLITIEPSNVRGVTFGVNIPIEFVFGAEFELNENYGLFARVSAGPIIYVGNMAGNFTPFDLAGSFSGRFWFGFSWRR